MINNTELNKLKEIADTLIDGTDSEKAVSSMLNAIIGATLGNNEMLLATRITRVVQDELLPMAIAEKSKLN